MSNKQDDGYGKSRTFRGGWPDALWDLLSQRAHLHDCTIGQYLARGFRMTAGLPYDPSKPIREDR